MVTESQARELVEQYDHYYRKALEARIGPADAVTASRAYARQDVLGATIKLLFDIQFASNLVSCCAIRHACKTPTTIGPVREQYPLPMPEGLEPDPPRYLTAGELDDFIMSDEVMLDDHVWLVVNDDEDGGMAQARHVIRTERGLFIYAEVERS